MIKLVPAKCPNCGAQLELDDNLKKIECEHCKSIIVVDDAIEKYKIEVSGEIKVKGILTEDDKLDNVEKFIKVGNIGNAKALVEKVLQETPFNIRALKLDIDINIPKNLSENTMEKFVSFGKTYIDEEIVEYRVNDKLNILKSLSENGEYDEFIKQKEEELSVYTKMVKAFNKDKKKLLDLIKSYIKSPKHFKRLEKCFNLQFRDGTFFGNGDLLSNEPTAKIRNTLKNVWKTYQTVNIEDGEFIFDITYYKMHYEIAQEKQSIPELLNQMELFLESSESKITLFEKIF